MDSVKEEILRSITIMARRCGVYEEDIWTTLKTLVKEHE